MKKPKFDPKRPLSSRHRPPSGGLTLGSAKWRLFAMLAGVLLVIKLAESARDPATWKLFFPGDLKQQVRTQKESEPETKLAFKPSAVHYDPPGTFVVAGETPAGATLLAQATPQANDQPIDASAQPQKVDALESAWKEAWRDIFPRLANEDRAMLYRSLKAARDGAKLDEKYRPPLKALLELLDRTWTGYQAEATGSLNDLADDDKAAWLDVLRRLGVRWSEAVAPALTSLAEGHTPDEAQRAALADLQTLLDELLLAGVKDDSVWRTGEAEIWFRLIEKMRARGPKDPEVVNAPEVTYVQLFKQSNAYRGETVKIRGNARQAWYIKAPENWCGVEGYYIFVLKPPEVTSPILVYALELPPGFPPVADLDKAGAVTELDEPVEFTGVFFKRGAYTSVEGSRTAPLLMAKVAKWTPGPKPFNQQLTPERKQTLLTIAICLLGGMSVCLAVIWRFQFRRGPRVEESPDLAAELRALEKLPTAPTVKEQLRDLEQRSDS